MFRSKSVSGLVPSLHLLSDPSTHSRTSADFVPTVFSSPSVSASSCCCVNPRCIARQRLTRVTPFPAALTGSVQLAENPATLSLAFATLTNRVKHKSCVCHSYKKHRGVGSFSSTSSSRFTPIPFSLFPHLVNIQHAATPATPILSSVYCTVYAHPGGAPNRRLSESTGRFPGHLCIPSTYGLERKKMMP